MRPIVREFCRQRGVDYQEASLYQALASVGNHLGEMTAAYNTSVAGQQVRPDESTRHAA